MAEYKTYHYQASFSLTLSPSTTVEMEFMIVFYNLVEPNFSGFGLYNFVFILVIRV